MATQAVSAEIQPGSLKLELLARVPKMRVLAWKETTLYASRGYTLLAGRVSSGQIVWQTVGRYRPEWWRTFSSRSKLTSRLVRDGFHALGCLPSGLVAALPGAIAILRNGETDFRVTHRVKRGTRPLHITAVPDGRVYWGEYFDNPHRDEVHIYASADGGQTWDVAHTFAQGSIRHVHNIVYDCWENCLWIFTGDNGSECRILRASLDFSNVVEVAGGNQQARAVAAVVVESGIDFATDTPSEKNHIYYLDRRGKLQRVAPISSSSISACRNRTGLFFSTMVEPSDVNRARHVEIFGSQNGLEWDTVANWRKDRWPMKLFQYGNAFLPDGENSTDLLAVSTVAVEKADLETTIWRTVNA